MKDLLPRNSDRLFKDEADLAYGAWLKNPANKYFLYSEGYKEVGQIIYNHCEKERYYANILVYPLVFNYRQFIELRLKELLTIGFKFLDVGRDFPDIHDLVQLWRIYRAEVLIKIETIEDEILNSVEHLMEQFEREDPKSMSFRYPFTKAPIRKNTIKRETIDLGNFKEVIDRLIFFLDWQWDMLSHYTDLKQEYRM